MPSLAFLRIFVILAALHAFIGWRILPDLPVALSLRLLGALWLVLSCALVPLGFFARRIKRQPLSDRASWAGMLAMGFFSTLLVLTIVRDLLLGLSYLATAMFGIRWPLALHGVTAAAVPLLALALTLIGLSNARRRARVVAMDVPCTRRCPRPPRGPECSGPAGRRRIPERS